MYRESYPRSGSTARMLAEYSRWPLVRTVGIDSFYYRPGSAATLDGYAAAVPDGFPLVAKVWNRVTAHTFTAPEDGPRRGQRNPDWLNAELFRSEVLEPMVRHLGTKLGPLVFEMPAIPARAITPAGLADSLDRFFERLPPEHRYAVELRNAELLGEEYLAVLREHRVAHVFGSWTRMPPIGEQLALHDSITADFVVMRALNRPGRSFDRSVELTEPFDSIRDPNPALRNDIVALARSAIDLRIPAYLLVGNRAEGCAPLTIFEVARMLTGEV